MLRTCLLLVAIATALPAVEWWSRWRGPAGGGSQPGYDGELIADPAAARQVWKSAYVPKVQDSGYSSPVVADGRVYVAYYEGDRQQKDQKFYDKLREGRDFKTEEQRLALASPVANDLIACFDAKTGETLWTYTSPSTGLNQQGSNKAGGHFTPCVGEGAVVAFGSAGILFCVEAETGEERWQVPVAAFQRLRDLRDKCKAAGTAPPMTRARGFMPCSAPVITDGVVVVSDHGGHVGFRLADGKRLWRVGGNAHWQASPLLWQHGGRNYVIGVGNCIDPRTGEVLWALKPRQDFGHGSGTPALEGDVLVFSGARNRGGDDFGASGWRLSTKGAEKLWQLEGNLRVSGNCTSPGIHAGVAYLHCSGAFGKNQGCVLAIDTATGEELARHDGIWYVKLTTSVTGMADRVFIVQCNQRFRIFGTGKDFAELKPTPDDELGKSSGADWGAVYANSTTPALVGGLMYFRGTDAVYCYDLRKR